MQSTSNELIEWVDISTLRPNPKNPNQHSADQIKRLSEIIKYQGWRHPIIVSKNTGYIAAGHGRLEAAKKLGCLKVPVHIQEFLNADQEYAFLVSDNAIASWAELDLASVNLEIPNLGPDFDVDMLGLEDFVIEPADKNEEEDVVPHRPEVTTIKRGDLFLLGEHRLLCGDATSREDVERLMNGEKADMVFTDPPYGFGYGGDFSLPEMDNKGVRGRNRNHYTRLTNDSGEWDFDPTHILDAFDYCKDIFLWGGDYYCWKLPKKGSWICWNKIGDNKIMDNIPGSSFELCWSKTTHKRHLISITWRGCFGHNKKTDGDKKVHPTQKPTKLAEWFFQHFGKDTKLVWDGYLGSGSTLIACEKTGRKCFGLEIDPTYVSVILDRFEKYSGKEAVREDGVRWVEIKKE